MPAINVAKASRSNPIYARHLRWIDRYSAVVAALGFAKPPESAAAFAQGVAAWQGKHGLEKDGMLGPRTWTKLRPTLRPDVPIVPTPDWMSSRPEAEGWEVALLATLRQDTSFLRLNYKSYSIAPKDFTDVADLVESGAIGVEATDFDGASYEFRNDEPDANTIKVPRRARKGWRRSQALIIHEISHVISDKNGRSVDFLDEEAVAYVVQAMFLVHFKEPLAPHDPHRRALYGAAATLARQYLKGETPKEADWTALRDVIRNHPTYRPRLKRFKTLEFDGIPPKP